MHLPRTVSLTPLTGFDSAGQFFTTPYLHNDKFPPFIQDSLDPGRHVNHLTGRNDFIVAVYIAIKQLLIPERVLYLPVLVQVWYVVPMRDVAFASQRCYRARVRLH